MDFCFSEGLMFNILVIGWKYLVSILLSNNSVASFQTEISFELSNIKVLLFNQSCFVLCPNNFVFSFIFVPRCFYCYAFFTQMLPLNNQ